MSLADSLIHTSQRELRESQHLMSSLPAEVVLKIFNTAVAYSTERWIEYLIAGGPLIPDPAVRRYDTRPRVHDDDIFQFFLETRDYPKPYDWIRLTHVCRAWRQLALSTTSLWTHIAIAGKSGDIAMEMLRRSGDQPLTVTCEWRRELAGSLRDIISHFVSRISIAVLPMALDLFTPTLAQNAANLERLIFVTPDTLGNPATEFDGIPYNFPSLKYLRTVAVLSDSFAHLFSRTLTSLELRYHWEELDWRQEPNWAHPSDVLADALMHTPLLEILRVDVYEWTDPVTAAPILPNLRQLDIRGAVLPCVALYQALQIPRNTRIQLDCKASEETHVASPDEAIQAIASALTDQSVIDGSKLEPAVAFAFGGNTCEYQLRGWRSPLLVDGSLNDDHADVLIILPIRCTRDAVMTLLTAIPLPRPEILRLGPFPFTESDARTALTLPTLPSLKTVTVKAVTSHVACSVVASTPASDVYFHDMEFRRIDHKKPYSEVQQVWKQSTYSITKNFSRTC